MRRLAAIILLAVGLPTAGADIVQPPALADVHTAFAPATSNPLGPNAVSSLRAVRPAHIIFQPAESPTPSAAPAARALARAPRSETAVVRLPHAPSSLTLSLTALLGLGAFQAGRTIRKIQLSALPEWYHADDVQVGYATPLDPHDQHLPVCVLEPLPRPAIKLVRMIRFSPDDDIPSCSIPLAAVPRGPPC